MSEEAAKFRIYVSYVPDETPAALISWLSEWSRFSLDDEAISFSNPSATATELQAAVSNCQMVLHILTKNSFNFLHCQREMDSARLFQCPIIGIQTDDREPNAVQFDAVISSIGELRVFLRHILSLYTLFESAEDEAAWSVVLTAATTLLPQYPLVRGKLLLRFWEMQGLFNILVGRLRSLLAQTNVHPIAHSELARLDDWLTLSRMLYRVSDLSSQPDFFVRRSSFSRVGPNVANKFARQKLNIALRSLHSDEQFSLLRLENFDSDKYSVRSLHSDEQFSLLRLENFDSDKYSVTHVLGLSGSGKSSILSLYLLNLETTNVSEISEVLRKLADEYQANRLQDAIYQHIEEKHYKPSISLLPAGNTFETSTTDTIAPATITTPARFTLYNPGQVVKQRRYSLIVYTHKVDQQGIVAKDARKFADELGDAPKERHSAEPIPLEPKMEITIVPEAEGITFDPPELTKTWDEKWLRFNFDFEVPDTYKHEEVPLHISVQVKGFEVACIKSSCEVVAETVAAAAPALPDDPLVDPPRESGTRKADAHLYRNVFLSYSHKDEEIAWRRAREIEQALGDRVFMDVKDLRAGEDWETRLFEWIDQADIIHLLWSENSSQSDFCRREWTYALEKKCGDTRCFGVIRPVYWQKPMPTPPPELAHLHFQPIKLEDA